MQSTVATHVLNKNKIVSKYGVSLFNNISTDSTLFWYNLFWDAAHNSLYSGW